MSKDIRILETLHLRGPNIWTYRPAVEVRVDIDELEDFPSNTLPGFYERLSAWLPGLIEHECSYGERGGFLRRVQEGTWPAHIMEHVALELQTQAGQRTGFGKARSTSQRSVYKIVIRSRQKEVSLAALRAARDLVMAAIEDRPFDVPATVTHLHELADSLCLGPSTACIVDAAQARNVPAIRLLEDGNLVQLGWGRHQRRVWTAETDRTSAIAENIACDKDLTKSLLIPCGVPVPEGQVVRSADEAWDAAQDIGLPVVVKPSDANHARGVSLELMSEEEVKAAYPIADAEGSDVIVERFIQGVEHRLLVVGGKLVAAGRGEQIHLTGDGQSTVRALIDTQLNSDPRRGDAEEFPLETIRVDSDQGMLLLLKRQGFTPDTVPAAGQRVVVQRNGNVCIDCTDEVHPEVAATAALAARIVGLDIAGIDLVTTDVSRPLAETRGAIVEVNAGPGLLMHLKPAVGQPRPVGEAIADHLFPEGDGRIPVIGITGSAGTTRLARLIGWLLYVGGYHAGVACRDGLFVDQRQFERGDCANFDAGQRLLMNRKIDAAVFETAAAGILADGLPYDRCNVGVVTRIETPTDLARFDVHDAEKLASVLRTQVDVVLESGATVLNADDALVSGLADLSDGAVLLYGASAASPGIAEHCAKDGRAVFLEAGQVVLATGPARRHLRVPAQPEDLAGVAAAWALGIPAELIASGIESFDACLVR
ncbi:MAG: cyanophycin synthetase [Candidatus Dactylopiibacterium carminicum]|uniref:Cyanophycin synthetase n=1 Tax=Candidatus Dactylopiibacterium carminicum TaxID=857335 RepID=A0A272EWL6_9RHOO|nr:cyanophycin synthetase [Candidatus Dactylopiibacterium carminicum]KAF7599249.1 cyanophycin synthetase [Candidatus Dactylopiibacterium carminicum]PAS94495.1 MAG: cyanophycin synthetase [Candidatus Dactylopiibacterium carminicum]PAS99256.1 MAG: cyanophycin synthetase [Candidatus Dactylopiibacterium carminicum]